MTPDEERATWQWRAISATRGNQTQLGAILIAVIGKKAKHPPYFGKSAIITSDGFVMADFTTRDGVFHPGAFVGSVRDLIANLRGLADHLKLSDEDRKSMFDEAKRWISTDYRDRRDWA